MTGSFAWDRPNGTAAPMVFPLMEAVRTRKMQHVTNCSGIQAATDVDTTSSRSANTSRVRLKLLCCRSQGGVGWSVAEPGMALIVVRTWTKEVRITTSDGPGERIASGCTKFWLIPDGIGAWGELHSVGPFDCASILVDPSALPSAVRTYFSRPISGLVQDRLRSAFDALGKDLQGPDHIAALVAEGWALRALAHVARLSTHRPGPSRKMAAGGLAPWQLSRATALLGADLTENQPVQHIAAACRLSATHFCRAFKQSMGMPPHQWLMHARVERARDLLLRSTLPLVHIASQCGFSDQSHFCKVFRRFEGVRGYSDSGSAASF
jgi:AraC family transcriptional regulator